MAQTISTLFDAYLTGALLEEDKETLRIAILSNKFDDLLLTKMDAVDRDWCDESNLKRKRAEPKDILLISQVSQVPNRKALPMLVNSQSARGQRIIKWIKARLRAVVTRYLTEMNRDLLEPSTIDRRRPCSDSIRNNASDSNDTEYTDAPGCAESSIRNLFRFQDDCNSEGTDQYLNTITAPYTKNTILFLNGEFTNAVDTHLDLYSQTQYGFVAFEGIRAYRTANGTKIFKAYEHFERLKNSCALVGIPFKYETEELVQIAYQLLDKNDLSDAYIRPLVYSGRNMQLTQTNEVYVMMSAWKWNKYANDKHLRMFVSSYQRPNMGAMKTEAKVTGHYVNSILANGEAKAQGYDEALMLDMNGNIAEAPGANFFLEQDGVLYTPALGHILPGITRQTILNICRELDIPVKEKQIRPEELESADGAFLCGTAAEIVAIESVGAKPFKKQWHNCLAATLQEAYKCAVLEKAFSYVRDGEVITI